jgi:hypothetical protein
LVNCNTINNTDEDLQKITIKNGEFKILERATIITGPFPVGEDGKISLEWKLYETIRVKYGLEIIEKEYFKTKSVIAKTYVYLILWEKQYENLNSIQNDIEKYINMEFNYCHTGCIIDIKILKEIIEELQCIIKIGYRTIWK